jgi:hypothetical protein
MVRGEGEVATIEVGEDGTGRVTARHPAGETPFGGTLRHLGGRQGGTP